MENNETTRFLKISIVLVSIFCVVVFSVQTVCMNFMGEEAIRQLGVMYMSGMSKQVASHFGTTIELRLSQVEALVEAAPPGRFVNDSFLQVGLTYNARSRGFEYLAFYTDDGNFHMIYGSQVKADVPEALHRSVRGGKYNVCAGKDAEGTPVVLMGVPAAYPIGDGVTSAALVAGLPTSYLSDTLKQNAQGSMVDYSIIRDDGSYVLQNVATQDRDYFEGIDRFFEQADGKASTVYMKEFKQALEQDRDYTCDVMAYGERWNLYLTSLPNSEWHLLLKISHSTLDGTVTLLRKHWSYVSIGGCSLIMLALLLVFIGYFRLTRKQMRALDEARMQADQARESAEHANKVKSEFLSNMSHDIRTPMNGIMGMTSIAINNLNDPPRVRACLKKINISSRHLLGLINDMLDMSKIGSGKLTLHMEPLSLRDVMQNITTVIRPQIQEKNQHFLVYVYDISHEDVCSDRVRLSQILLNILGNAVKFTPDGGTIEVSLYEEPSPKGSTYVRSCLHIKDNGIGMSQEFKTKIFDAFAREDHARVDKEAGAGMGLTITKYIVDAMGGTITVESEQGRGTDFYVAIDMEKALQQELEFHLQEREAMVVDDDKTAGAIAVNLLKSIGLQAEWTPDIQTVFSMVEERCQQGGDCPIILLDWDMEGQDSMQAVAGLHRRFGSMLPVLLFSDGEWDELEAEGEKAGVDGYLEKPLFRSSLYYGLRAFTEKEAPQLQDKEKEDAEDEDVSLAGRHVLVAEDNQLNWEIAEAILSELDMEVEWAQNGRICVEKFEQSDVGWYDVILMDLRMPQMSGFEAAEAIRKLERSDAGSIPIIAVSADAFADDVQKCFDCGMNAHTAKPFDLSNILMLFNKFLQ